MNALISGYRYDTEESKRIGAVNFDGGEVKERWWEESLYRTRDGRWYLVACGGSLSKHGRCAEGECGSSAAKKIVPLRLWEAREWGRKTIRKMLRVDASTSRPSRLEAKVREKLERLVGLPTRSRRAGMSRIRLAAAGGDHHGG